MAMKRSEINASIARAIAWFDQMAFAMPAWARFSPADWAEASSAYDEIRRVGLAWDVTDFGSGDLARIGRTIFTLRNGKPPAGFPKSYAEKVMHLPPGQRSITHYHKQKREDIVCRAGTGVGIRLWAVAEDGRQSEAPLTLAIDGVAREVEAGEVLTLRPGQSLHVPPLTYHQFWGIEGDAETLSVEVSSVCDDEHDNFFIEPFGERFPEIIEDEPRRWVLCSEYGKLTPTAASSRQTKECSS